MADIAATGFDSPASAVSRPYRVLVVDDSAVIRGLLARLLESDPEISVVDTVANGRLALAALRRRRADIVVLDTEMPVMDGLTALPELLKLDPEVKVIMASTPTPRNAELSLRGLALGACDYIPKPTTAGEIVGGFDFKRELLDKVKALGQARRAAAAAVADAPGRPAPDRMIALRPPSALAPGVLAIGGCTGGPQALFRVLGDLGGEVAQPILIAQHMPATFTPVLARHIGHLTQRPCAEGVDGREVLGGSVYVAPGNRHMTVETGAGGKVIRLSQTPPENFCRPAVDVMLRSLAQAYGGHVLAVILSGMGEDGVKGGAAVVEAGGTVIAQDETTSTVWGMPGAAAAAGLCSAVLPLEEIGPWLARMAKGTPR